MTDVKTVFGALHNYQKSGVEVISDDPKHYGFSNVFEVAEKAKPYKRVAVGKNFEYVIEALRAEGDSPWYACAHDEFALVMDGKVEVRLLKPDRPLAPDGKNGAVALTGAPGGRKMGRIIAGRGHMALLPKGSAYQFHADQPSVVTIQTVHRSGQRTSAPPGYLDCLYPQSKDRRQDHESYLPGGPERTEEHSMMAPENWAEMSVDEKADWLGLQEWDHLTVHEKLDWLHRSFALWIETANRLARAFMITQVDLHNSIVKFRQELQKADRKLQRLSDKQN